MPPLLFIHLLECFDDQSQQIEHLKCNIDHLRDQFIRVKNKNVVLQSTIDSLQPRVTIIMDQQRQLIADLVRKNHSLLHQFQQQSVSTKSNRSSIKYLLWIQIIHNNRVNDQPCYICLSLFENIQQILFYNTILKWTIEKKSKIW